MVQPPPLPKYKKPPVVETVLGVQFAPLTSFTIPHFGLFWSTVRDDYPRHEMKPPLGTVVENLARPPVPDRVSIKFVAEPEARCWFLNTSGTELLQLQRDRFVRNWRKVTGSEDYPSYDALKPRFVRDWSRLLGFLEREELGRPQVNQCEVTYINHLSVDVETLGEAHRFARGVAPLSGDFLPVPETTQLQVRYPMGDKRGRLHIAVHPGVRFDDRRPVLQLGLTARGAPTSSRLDDILSWFDVGHEWVVRGFTDFTRREMHALWERIQ
jgi:uncharacterized protein (TIGR04255 family)